VAECWRAAVCLQVKRIGKYKSAGDQLLRKDMSEAQREQLSALLDGLYDHFLTYVAKVCLPSACELRQSTASCMRTDSINGKLLIGTLGHRAVGHLSASAAVLLAGKLTRSLHEPAPATGLS
jgi:hypothetical protein